MFGIAGAVYARRSLSKVRHVKTEGVIVSDCRKEPIEGAGELCNVQYRETAYERSSVGTRLLDES